MIPFNNDYPCSLRSAHIFNSRHDFPLASQFSIFLLSSAITSTRTERKVPKADVHLMTQTPLFRAVARLDTHRQPVICHLLRYWGYRQ